MIVLLDSLATQSLVIQLPQAIEQAGEPPPRAGKVEILSNFLTHHYGVAPSPMLPPWTGAIWGKNSSTMPMPSAGHC
ncbi:MAG: hypothetical protein HC922_03270, partial [Leptolyngbyaceae cyanobacterium SM2_3_12]|nr:hypothetical protein [Leptolyngbyaceae cyanobacterium SM2_3_12]